MTDIEKRAIELENQARTADAKERLKLQPQIDAIVSKLSSYGHPVSSNLRQLNRTLNEEAIEDMFDNLPV